MSHLGESAIDASLPLYRLPPESWIQIASFLPTLREFVRLWVTSQQIQKQLPKADATFWKALLEFFLAGRQLTLESISVSIIGPSKFLSSSRKVQKGCYDDFRLMESLFTKRKCSRSGCFRFYEEWANFNQACCYHPGQLKSGMFLSCCRAASFQESGCKYTFHSGMFHFMLTHTSSDKATNSSWKSCWISIQK